MIFPTREDIIELNHYHIRNTGGFFNGVDNLQNAGSLEWVLDAIQHPLFSVNLYPGIAEKAAILTWIIIDGHVFHDGNKRTGMSVLSIFLRVNGYYIDASDDEFIEVALKIAGGNKENYSWENFVQWIRGKLSLLRGDEHPIQN